MFVEHLQRWNSECKHNYAGSGNTDVYDKPHSMQPCTAIHPWNKEYYDQFICMAQQILTKEVCRELNNCFNMLELMLAMLRYQKVCAGWVIQMHA